MSTSTEIAGVVDCGSHPLKEQTLVFNFRGFETIATDQKGKVVTPHIYCHGYHWYLHVQPDAKDKESSEHVSLFLGCRETLDGSVASVRARFNVRAANHPLSTRKGKPRTYSKSTKRWGYEKCWSREQAISFCDAQGTLGVEVTLQVYPDEQEVNCWKPGKTNEVKLASLYDSKTHADAAFVVGDRRFEVHRLILQLNAPTLAEILDDNATTQQEDVALTGVDPDLFGTMIRFLYTEDLPPSFNDNDHALELLKLADKFGCSNLKMLLEARIVETPQLFCPENVADLFVLADAKNCALLLERSLKMIVESFSAVQETAGWKHVEASTKLMSVIVGAATMNHRKTVSALAFEGTSVSVLRERAFEQGLDADGSREDLIKRLKENFVRRSVHC